MLYCSRNQENNRGADAAHTAVTVTRRIYEEAITMNENIIEAKELAETETEKVTGGGTRRLVGPGRKCPTKDPCINNSCIMLV